MVLNLGQHRTNHPMKKRNFLFLLNKLQKLVMEKSRKQIKKVAGDVAHNKGLLENGKSVSDGWYHGFMKRQSHLSF